MYNVDLSDLHVDLSVIYVDLSDHYVELSEKISSQLVAKKIFFLGLFCPPPPLHSCLKFLDLPFANLQERSAKEQREITLRNTNSMYT